MGLTEFAVTHTTQTQEKLTNLERAKDQVSCSSIFDLQRSKLLPEQFTGLEPSSMDLNGFQLLIITAHRPQWIRYRYAKPQAYLTGGILLHSHRLFMEITASRPVSYYRLASRLRHNL